MEEVLNQKYYYNTIREWLIAFTIIFLTIIVAKIITWFSNKILKRATAKTKSNLDDILIDMLEEPIVFALSLIGIWIALEQLHFPVSFKEFINKSYHFLITLNITWLIARTLDAIMKEYVLPLVEKSENNLDDQILPIARKGIRLLIWTLGIIVALNNAGYNVGALIAGLGIGGLAFAMAAKDTLSNFFGGLTILTDKPFKIGDRININGYDGFITDIGIRSSRLKTLEGRIVTIPNAKFTDNFIENISSEPSRKVTLNLGLTYDTPPEKIEKAIALLKDVIKNNSSVEQDNNPIGFTSFGDFSLGILYIYYIIPGENILETQTAINLEILKQFNAEKLEFAFPTQTIHTVKA